MAWWRSRTYESQQREFKARLDALVMPEADAAVEAGTLLESLGVLWRHANQEERRRILLGMLEAVYVDMVQAHKVVAVSPKSRLQKAV